MAYELRKHEMQGVVITSAYTPQGHYIGDEAWAKKLDEMGIVPELRRPDNKVCSIGYCAKEETWYGWSHRAMYGFRIGSKVKKGDIAYKAPAAQEFLEDRLNFWRDPLLQTRIMASHHEQAGIPGILVKWTYSNQVANEKLRGKVSEIFTPYPDEFGRGEWTAKTLADAKEMACDYAEGVS